MPTYHIQTYGCQMNYSDSERMETYLRALGYKKTDNQKKADLILFNTCSIRQKAEDRVFGQMKKIENLKKNNPKLMVAITGCMIRNSSSRYSPQRDKLFNKIRELDIALKTEDLSCLASLVREINPDIKIPKIKEENLKDYFKIKAAHNTFNSKTQAFLPISNGCDKFCTYCIVPYSRGREKSRKIEGILKEAEELTANGYKEITLIGQTVNSYGKSCYDKDNKNFEKLKNKDPFVYLLEEMDKLRKKGLERVRFSSPHPMDMSDELIDAMAKLKTQMPFLHLPVQSGDNNVLKIMNRPYTIEQYRKIIHKLRKKIPDISITTDIIVGFCGETDKEFQNTCGFFEEMQFEHAYIAQYSNRKGTTADRFMNDDVPQKIKKLRWEKLNNILENQSKKALKRFIGKTSHVLVEVQKGKICTGRNEHFKTVQFKISNKSKKRSEKYSGKIPGKIVPVLVTGSKEWILEGELRI
ncbi:tRNA (N6-isopentenyl adenosine(37)-C2)-methylthiotransferase MiaB [Candidatus Peregrinibacteria bacterium]|nr:tRNA (N6-isopentenyl adenosine(37)-C2)-methylthiotransferase MiaB [Candidatus Peregrinibacteria bacterium]